MRTTFINTLIAEARLRPNIFLLCADLGYSVLEPFAEEFPDRFLNVGIAEQNMHQLAAGLAMEGYKVFTYSIGNFPTLRSMEQIRYDICYHQLDVTIVAVGGGYAYGPLGTSHHTTEDLGMLRTLPGMTVTSSADPVETEAITRYLCAHQGPAYIRLNKAGEKRLHTSPVEFSQQRLLPLINEQGRQELIITAGAISESVVSSQALSANPANVWTMPFINPVDHDTLVSLARQYTTITTIEEHQLNAGLGSAIAESLIDAHAKGELERLPKIKRIGIPNTFQFVAGSQEWLQQQAGLRS